MATFLNNSNTKSVRERPKCTQILPFVQGTVATNDYEDLLQ